MNKYSNAEIIALIDRGETFDAICVDGSFTLKIASYVPYVCAAIHDGHQFRTSLLPHCLHTEYERWYEEDPCTKQMIASHPIVIAGCDSRFEYDLNRAPKNAIYEDAWGKKLWSEPLPEEDKEKSLKKHHGFYQVVKALITKLESMFDACVVYDMHSYNWKRWDRPVPTWNLGTANVDQERFKEEIAAWSSLLAQMQLPRKITSVSAINDTFQGNGYFLKFITAQFKNTLVLATEVKKVYCDELTGEVFDDVVLAIANALNEYIPSHLKTFLALNSK